MFQMSSMLYTVNKSQNLTIPIYDNGMCSQTSKCTITIDQMFIKIAPKILFLLFWAQACVKAVICDVLSQHSFGCQPIG